MTVVLHEVVEVALGQTAAGLAQVNLRVLLKIFRIYTVY
jgi:hypothetical protein